MIPEILQTQFDTLTENTRNLIKEEKELQTKLNERYELLNNSPDGNGIISAIDDDECDRLIEKIISVNAKIHQRIRDMQEFANFFSKLDLADLQIERKVITNKIIEIRNEIEILSPIIFN